MKHFLTTLLLATLCATGYGQTIKSLGYNTTNGDVVYAGTNPLVFTNAVFFGGDASINPSGGINYGGSEVMNLEERTLVGDWAVAGGLSFFNTTNAATTRTNLGLGATWLTNTNVTNFRTAIGLGATNEVLFDDVLANRFLSSTFVVYVGSNGIEFEEPSVAAITRTNLEAARAPILAYKATNQTNSTTNLVSDTALSFTAAANTKYAVTLFIMIQSTENTVGNISSTNSTVYGYWNTLSENTYLVPTSTLLTNAHTFFLADGGAGAAVQNFTVVGGTNSGSVTFQFHGAVTSEPAIIGAGSYLKAEVIE
jgi:hypothetical protein